MKIFCEKKIYLRSLAGLSAPVGIWIELIPIPLSGCRSTFQSVTAPRVLAFVPGWAVAPGSGKYQGAWRKLTINVCLVRNQDFAKQFQIIQNQVFLFLPKGPLGWVPFFNDHMNRFSNNGLFDLKEKVVHPPSAPARPDLHYRSCRSLSFPHLKFNSTEKRQKIWIKRISPCSNMKYPYFHFDNCTINLSNAFFVQCLVSAYSLSKWAKHYM